VVYAVPWNEGRGIYYVHSDTEGQDWAPANRIFDALAKGWPSADRPVLGADLDGRLYVVWGRANLPDDEVSEGIYAAFSIDRGETWSDVSVLADDVVSWPQITVARAGQAHVIWQGQAGKSGWQHTWTSDGGHTWGLPSTIRPAQSMAGASSLVGDLAGSVYLVGVARDGAGTAMMRYSRWESASEAWSEADDFPIVALADGNVDTVAALGAGLGELDALFVGDLVFGENASSRSLLHMKRAIEPLANVPSSLVTPEPTATPTVTPLASPMPKPTPTVNAIAPGVNGPILELGPITLPLLSVVGLGGVMVTVIGVLWIRIIRRRRKSYGASYYYYHQ